MNKRKLLYVDDEHLNLMLFEANLKSIFDVIIAENGVQGLELINKNTDINIVISDMRMPEMNGIEFIKKAKDYLPNANYYILTGYGMTSEIKEALDNQLILKKFNKPFDINEVINELQGNIQ